jgi:hypothetical protein
MDRWSQCCPSTSRWNATSTLCIYPTAISRQRSELSSTICSGASDPSLTGIGTGLAMSYSPRVKRKLLSVWGTWHAEHAALPSFTNERSRISTFERPRT